jgi:signal peptidase II
VSSNTYRLCFCLAIGLCIFLSDLASKASISFIANKKPSQLPITLFSNFFGIDAEISYAINEGAAWGMFHQFPVLLVFCRIGLIVGLLIYLIGYNHSLSSSLPLTCIISGAIGNVYDYFYYGHVVDMIQLRFWGYEYPVFNIADTAIFCGAFWLIITACILKPKP